MLIIGQEKLKENLIKSLPLNTILVGDVGLGKKTLAQFVCEQLHIPCFILSNKVEDLRQIEILNHDYVYILSDFDTCSINAKNSMLKILEEDTYPTRFILTCSNINEVPLTIQSRCQIYYLQPYSKEELMLFCNNQDIVEICDTPQEVVEIEPIFSEFSAFCDKVIHNLEKISLSNALKIGQYLQFKKDSSGYNLKLFFKILLNKYLNMFNTTHDMKYITSINITTESLNDLRLVSAVKQMVFDNWVFKMKGFIS